MLEVGAIGEDAGTGGNEFGAAVGTWVAGETVGDATGGPKEITSIPLIWGLLIPGRNVIVMFPSATVVPNVIILGTSLPGAVAKMSRSSMTNRSSMVTSNLRLLEKLKYCSAKCKRSK